MSKGLKIFASIAGVMVFFGVVSLIFLLTAKNKSQPVVQTNTKTAPVKAASPVPKKSDTVPDKTTSQPKASINKSAMLDQWKKCSSKTMDANTNLFWNIQILESIPQGGTYAKGNLNSDSAYPVRVIIKSGAQNADKLNQMLAVGKTPLVRGTCTDIATDGSVVLQAF